MEAPGTCPICFEDLKEKETASPDVCDHIFCLLCLQKWAKMGGSFCPVDRKRFKKIIDLTTSAPMQIKPRKRKKNRVLYDVSVHCEVCSKSSDGNTLLLCDCCDLGYHCKCLTPPLKTVPSGVWNCPLCVAVSEKIRTKKGISKEVETIARDHTNYWDDSSDSSSYDSSQEKNNNGRALKNSFINETTGFSVNDMPKKSALQRCLRKSRKLRSPKKTLPRIGNLRPRNRHIKYDFFSLSSSESNMSVECDEKSRRNMSSHQVASSPQVPQKLRHGRFEKSDCMSGYNNSVCSTSDEYHFRRNSKKNNNSKKLRLRSHRSPKKVRRDDRSYSNSSENSSSSECELFIYSERKNFTQSKPLDLSTNETVDYMKIKDTSNSECDDNKYEISNKCMKKSNSCEVRETTEIPSTQAVSPSQEVLNFQNKLEQHSPEMCLPFISEVHQDKKIFDSPNLTKEKLTCSKALQLNTGDERLLENNLLNENLLILDEITFSDSELLLPDSSNQSTSSKSNDTILNKNQEVEMPVFSVFEKLEDVSVSEEKYSNINLAVTEDFQDSKTDSQIIKYSKKNPSLKLPSQYSDTHHNFKDNLDCQNNFHGQKALNISKELREIEREKWKTLHLRKNPKVSPRILCCSALDRNHPCACNTVEVGKHCQHNKYSDNYNRFLSITKSLRKKTRYDKYDTAIIPSFDVKKLVKKKYCHTPNIQNICSVNCISSFPEKSLNLDFNNHGKHSSIPIETEKLLHYKETESELLGSIVCLTDINQLSVKKDGALFIDWHHS